VSSGSGHINLVAGDDIDLDGNVSAGSVGSIYLLATNGAADSISGVDMRSGSLIAAATGNVRIVADNEGNILLSQVRTAGDVSLIAEGSILDNNASSVVVNVQANSLRMVADASVSHVRNQAGTIGTANLLNGTPTVNANAINTAVSTLAAISADGIYVQELDAVTIGATGDISVAQVNFNSTRTTLTDLSLSDLITTHDGPIKVLSSTGNIVINGGDGNGLGIQANGAGDILLRTAANDGDVVVNSNVLSGFGHISLLAGDDVLLNADVVTGASLPLNRQGSVYVLATNGTIDASTGVEMQSGTSITTANGNVRIAADNEGDIRLGLIDVGTASVSLVAEGSILDNNAGLNVRSSSLRIWADAVVLADGSQDIAALVGNGLGSIGTADAANGQPQLNSNAIKTQVSILSAHSATGIYVQEVDGLTVSSTRAISVQQSNFNSTTTTITDSDWEDAETTTNGSIKLQTLAGNLVLSDGNANGYAVRAHGSDDVLLQTLATDGDIIVNADVLSATGHISLLAADDLHLNASGDLATGGSGTIYLQSGNGTIDATGVTVDGINLNATITTADGDILLRSARDIRLNGDITSGTGDIGLIATRDVVQSSAVATGASFFVDAGGSWTMLPGGSVTANRNLLALVGVDINLDVLAATNVSLQAGGNIIDANGGDVLNIASVNLIMRAGGAIGASDLLAAPSVNANAIDIDVDNGGCRFTDNYWH
jgi:membrane-bound inhibitor of C-type lysozyme